MKLRDVFSPLRIHDPKAIDKLNIRHAFSPFGSFSSRVWEVALLRQVALLNRVQDEKQTGKLIVFLKKPKK